MLRRNLLLSVLALCVPFSIAAQSKEEIDLRELLLDMSAFLNAGSFSYNDYKSKVGAVVIHLDRYKRRNGSNKNLIAASESFIEAKTFWEQVFEEEELYITRKAIAGGITSKESIENHYVKIETLQKDRNQSWIKFDTYLKSYMKEAKPISAKPSTKK